MTDLLSIAVQFPDWASKVRRKTNELNVFMAAQIQMNRALMFDNEGAYNGHPKWASLKFRAGQILSDRGKLRRSIAPRNPKGTANEGGIVRFVGDQIIVGTNVMYAGLMNDGTTKMPGGVLRSKSGKALMITLPTGKSAKEAVKSMKKTRVSYEVTPGVQKSKNVIWRMSVRIPARNFTDWNDSDQYNVNDAFMAKLQDVLNG